MTKYWLVGFFSVCLSCISQMLLKKGAMKSWPTYIKEYLNAFVICGYIIMAICVFLTIYMYTGMQLKYGAVIEAAGYIIILFIGRIVFNEKITSKKVIGNLLIIAGIVVFHFSL